MKRLFLALAIAAVASFAVATTASADVARNQTQTGTITVNWAGGLIHVFHVTVNPCDGSFTGTGTSEQGVELNENVTGTLRDGKLTYTATYHDTPYDAYHWGYDGPAAGGMGWDSWGQKQPITVAYDLTSGTSYKNHGEYVSQMGGGADAARSRGRDSAFALTSMLIAVPTGIKIFSWIATIWGGHLKMTTAFYFALGFILEFTIGGLSGIMHASPPVDLQQTDTYFVVAHFHYVLFGGSAFTLFAGLALEFDTWWGFIVLVPLLALMHHGVILREEAYLEKKFGAAYRQYRARVRRYL